MKKIVSVLLAGLLCISLFAGCGSPNANNANGSQDKKELVIGLDPAFPPMGFTEENGDISGFDIDLAKEVGKIIGMEMKFQPIDWDSKEMELNTGKIDIIWNGLSVSAERAESMLLTKAYLKNKQVIVVQNDSPIKTKADLAGKNIVLQKGSTAYDAFEADPIKNEVKNLTENANNVDCFNDLEIGRADAMVIDEVVARYYIPLKGDKFHMLTDTLKEEEYAIAVKKGNTALKGQIESAIDKLIASGKTAELSKKWFGSDIFYWNEATVPEK